MSASGRGCSTPLLPKRGSVVSLQEQVERERDFFVVGGVKFKEVAGGGDGGSGGGSTLPPCPRQP